MNGNCAVFAAVSWIGVVYPPQGRTLAEKSWRAVGSLAPSPSAVERSSASAQRLEQPLDRLRDRFVGAPEPDVGVRRRLVRGVDAGETGERPGACSRVQAVRVAAFAFLQRRVDPRLDEVQSRLLMELPRPFAVGSGG